MAPSSENIHLIRPYSSVIIPRVNSPYFGLIVFKLPNSCILKVTGFRVRYFVGGVSQTELMDWPTVFYPWTNYPKTPHPPT